MCSLATITSASGEIMRQGFRVAKGLIFWYVTLEGHMIYDCIM